MQLSLGDFRVQDISKKEIIAEAIRKNVGVCEGCVHNKGFVTKCGSVLKLTPDNVSVRVVCSANPGQTPDNKATVKTCKKESKLKCGLYYKMHKEVAFKSLHHSMMIAS